MSDLVQLPPPEVTADVPDLVLWARNLLVNSPEDYQDAGERLIAMKGASKRIVDFFRPLKQSADQAKQAILNKEKEVLGPLREAEYLAKGAMMAYQRSEELKRQAEQLRLQREADERARKEREALEARAAKAKKPETVAKHLEAAAQVVAPVVHVAPTTPKVAGISTRTDWAFEIINVKDFLEFVFKHVRTDLVVPNIDVLDGYARSMKEQAAIPGVRFFKKEIMAARGA